MGINVFLKRLWSTFSSPVESFEEARINQYSSDVLRILASRKFNGQHVRIVHILIYIIGGS